MTSKTILCIATSPEDEPIPLFVGREDGTVEKYISITDSHLGCPSLVLRGHTKAVTAISVVTGDEIYTCSIDGTVKQWNADVEFEGLRTLKSVDTKTPLRCMRMNDGTIYAGGGNGNLLVVQGDRKTSFSGHSDAITAIAVTMDGTVVTGGADNQIRVWDVSLGVSIRLLVGHTNAVKSLVIVEDEEADDDRNRGAIVSFSRDRTMKVWRIPVAEEVEEEVEMGEEEKKAFMVSFKEPNGDRNTEAASPSGEAPTETPGEEVAAKPLAEEEAATSPPADKAPTEAAGEGEVEEATEGSQVPTTPTGIKSALKTKEHRRVPCDEALCTVELPEAPHSCYQEEESPLVYIGTTGGYVYGIQSKTIVSTVLNFVSKNKAMVRKDLRGVKAAVKKSVAAYKKEYRAAVRAEEKKVLKVAKRQLREKKAEEKEKKRKEREAKAAARAAVRAQRQQEMEEDEELDEQEEGEEEEGEELEERDEELDEQEEDEENIDRLRILSPEQRVALEKFVAEKAKDRDEKVSKLETALEEHLKKLEPVAKSTYDRKREEFHRLHWTTYTKVGKEGTLAVTAVNGKVYAAQGDRVVPTTVARGTTML